MAIASMIFVRSGPYWEANARCRGLRIAPEHCVQDLEQQPDKGISSIQSCNVASTNRSTASRGLTSKQLLFRGSDFRGYID